MLPKDCAIRRPMSIRKKVVFLLAVVLGLMACTLASAQSQRFLPSDGNITFSFSPNPVGSGARALGFGAFIAVADDATAASWNPGGLIQLKTPEISLVGECNHRNENNTFPEHPEANGLHDISTTGLNYLSFAYPFTLFNRNMVAAINYQRLYDFTRDVSYQYKSPGLDPINLMPIDGLYYFHDGNYHQSGGLSALGLAYGFEIIPQRLSFGITVNIWDDDFSDNCWKQTERGSSVGKYYDFTIDENVYEMRHTFFFQGINFNFGMLCRSANRKFSLGVVFKSPFTADVTHDFHGQMTGYEPTALSLGEELTMPMSYGIGVAYRFSDRFTISTDICRTHWEDFILKQADGKKISAVTVKPVEQSDVDPTVQIRLGAEYFFINKNKHYVVPVRMGLFYDPSPADKNPDDYYGFSLGTGFAKGRVVFDIAAQYRFGRQGGNSLYPDHQFSQDVDEINIYSSIIIHWK